MSILGIDPGKRCGWAHVVDGVVVNSGIMNGATVIGPKHLLDHWASLDLIVVEGRNVFFGAPCETGKRRRQMTPASIASMFYTTDIWRVLAELRGIPCEVVLPQEWQRHFRLTGKRDERGRAARALASSIAKRKVEEDEAQAILIALWASAKEGGK